MRRLLHLLSVTVVICGLVAPRSSAASSAQSPTDWPLEHFDAGRSGVNPFETILNAGNVDQLVQHWSQPIGNRHTFAESVAPAVWGGMVFAGGPHGLSAFDADTGELVWRRKLALEATPAVVDGVLYAGVSQLNGQYGVAALSASTGATLWQFPTGWLMRSSPAVVNGVVYIGSADGYVYALDAASGDVVWADPLAEMFSVISTPTVAQGIVYVKAGDLFALDAGTGGQIWQSDCHGYTTGTSGVTVVEGVAYAASFPGFVSYMCAWNAATGQLLWDVHIEYGGASDYVNDFVIDSGTLYGVTSGTLFALDAGTGAEIWHVDPDEVTGFAYLSLANGVLYVGGTGGILYHIRSDVSAFDPGTGELLWIDKLDAFRDVAIPAIVDGRLYLATDDDTVFAFALPP